MRAKKRLQRQLSLNKVLFASGFLFLLFLLFFCGFFAFVFSVCFLTICFSFACVFTGLPFFWWLAYFDSIQFVAFLCVHLILGSCVFSLLAFFAALLLPSLPLFLVIFFLLPITRSRRGECVLSTYIGHSPSCSYPKRNLKYVADGAGGEERGRGDAWVCVPPF